MYLRAERRVRPPRGGSNGHHVKMPVDMQRPTLLSATSRHSTHDVHARQALARGRKAAELFGGHLDVLDRVPQGGKGVADETGAFGIVAPRRIGGIESNQ